MSNILCGKNIAENVKTAISDCALTVTDTNLRALYPEFTQDAFVVECGEKNKNLQTLSLILTEMHRRGLNRRDRVAAFGGGVVGDMTGLAAALYMRGIDWVSIPTSLLAMVDSGIGGKTAVDFDGVKNLVGAFHSPIDIYINVDFLKTLPEREWLCGSGELVKTCVLDEDAYILLGEKLSNLTERDIDGIYPLIERAVAIKTEVVDKDLKESGLRKILNVGHTVGHALESLDGYKLSHGEYVLKGMMTEAAMCAEMMDEKFYGEYVGLAKRFTRPPVSSANSVCELARSDKKNDKGSISIMLPVKAGKIIEVKLSPSDFSARYNSAIKELKGK